MNNIETKNWHKNKATAIVIQVINNDVLYEICPFVKVREILYVNFPSIPSRLLHIGLYELFLLNNKTIQRINITIQKIESTEETTLHNIETTEAKIPPNQILPVAVMVLKNEETKDKIPIERIGEKST